VYGPARICHPYNLPVVAKPALTADEATPAVSGKTTRVPPAVVADVRSTRPAVLTRSALRLTLRRAASIASLVFLDLAGLALGLYIALVLRWLYYQHTVLWGVPWKAETKWLPFLILITLLVFWRNGLYAEREFRGGLGRIVSSLVLVTVLTLAFGLGTGYPFHTFGLAPTALVITTALIGLFRASYDVVTQDVLRLTGARRRAVLVGKGEHVAHLHRVLGVGRSGIDYAFAGAIAPDSNGVGLPVLGWLDELPAVLARTPVDELIVTDSDFEERELLEIVEHAHRRGVKVRVAPKTTELLTQRAEYVPGQGVPLFELRPPAFAAAQWAAKRAFDVLIGATIVVVGLPLWALIAAAVKLTSAGPVFYRDRRVGLGEREFGMLKFRTMYADAAERQDALEASNEAHGPLFKIKNDPRVTPVGRILRKYSLDEVPQVLNVLRGEMSLVGPRPLPVRDYVQLEPWHRKRYLVLPGMTGLWQVSGRIELSFDDLVRLDFYYLENWSIWLDITILAKTLPAVLARRGAY
jgi:exopolysaccharide biosynthesis polyprenyl glycosylphosphotransferase